MDAFNKLFAQNLWSLFEFVDETGYELREKDLIIKPQSLTEKIYEYGFYIYSIDKKRDLFFGIWFENWEETGQPISIVFHSSAADSNKDYYNFRKISTNYSNILSESTLIDDSYNIVHVNRNIIGLENGPEKLSNLIKSLSRQLLQ